MKLIILSIILAILIQTTLIPINLCLILILARVFVVNDSKNYYLALFSGILLGLLSSQNLAFYTLIFLILTKIISAFRSSALIASTLVVVPLAAAIFIFLAYLEQIVLGQSISLIKIIAESLVFIPTYILIRLWEERFVIRSEIKLKISK